MFISPESIVQSISKFKKTAIDISSIDQKRIEKQAQLAKKDTGLIKLEDIKNKCNNLRKVNKIDSVNIIDIYKETIIIWDEAARTAQNTIDLNTKVIEMYESDIRRAEYNIWMAEFDIKKYDMESDGLEVSVLIQEKFDPMINPDELEWDFCLAF